MALNCLGRPGCTLKSKILIVGLDGSLAPGCLWSSTIEVGFCRGLYLEGPDGIAGWHWRACALLGPPKNSSIGSSWSPLFRVRTHSTDSLDLFNNSLTGSFPSEVGSLSSLQYLNVGSNQFAGRVPTELGKLTGIATFRLEDNSFTGSMPSELRRLINADYLSLQWNKRNGTTPTTLFELSQLALLVLSNNDLTGPFPTTVGHLYKLYWLSI